MRNVFIYKKQDNFCYVYKYIMHDTLRYTIFQEDFEAGIYIQKPWHFALRDVFVYTNPDTLQKARNFVLRFYIQKSGHLALCNFHGIFKIGGVEGAFLCAKNNSLCITFL